MHLVYKMDFRATFSGALFNVSLNLLLIPTYGIIAAAVVTIITEGNCLVVALIVFFL